MPADASAAVTLALLAAFAAPWLLVAVDWLARAARGRTRREKPLPWETVARLGRR